MKKPFSPFLIIFLSLFFLTSAIEAKKKTNVIVILYDDMGYSDPEYMGGEALMPNLSKLAKNGVTFLNCMNNAKCAPTRCALMSGMNSMKLDVQGEKGGDFIKNNAASVAEVLQKDGYTTILAGKWHIRTPVLEAGFQYRFGERYHASYFKDSIRYLMNQDELVDKNTLPDDYYSTIAYTDYAMDTVKKQAIDKEKPFFLYYAVHTPHFNFSAPKEYIDKYKGRYDEGFNVLSEKRYQRMIDKGIVDPSLYELAPLSHDGEQTKLFHWGDFNSREQKYFARKLEVIAGMLDIADEQVGRLIEMLKETGQLDNTMIVFLSDNGACPVRGTFGGPNPNKANDEMLNKMGEPGFKSAGDSGTAIAAFQNTPLRGGKQSLWGGGMRTSMIIHWPEGMSPEASDGYVREPVQIMDIAPTIYEATGLKYPNKIGERILDPMDGTSLKPLLTGGKLPDRDFWFSFRYYRMARSGKYKAVGFLPNYDKKNALWQLFDLEKDPSEMSDLSQSMPEMTEKLKKRALSLHDKFKKKSKLKKNL